MRDSGVVISVSLDIQETYERAVAMRDGWGALADQLEKSGKVCPHPIEQRRAFAGAPSLCRACGKVVAP